MLLWFDTYDTGAQINTLLLYLYWMIFFFIELNRIELELIFVLVASDKSNVSPILLLLLLPQSGIRCWNPAAMKPGMGNEPIRLVFDWLMNERVECYHGIGSQSEGGSQAQGGGGESSHGRHGCHGCHGRMVDRRWWTSESTSAHGTAVRMVHLSVTVHIMRPTFHWFKKHF